MKNSSQISTTSPPSLADVAALAQVSTGTVSRTLSRPEMISEETRNRVMQAVDALGYVANGAARTLAMRRSKTIGAVVLKLGSSNFSQLVEGLESIVTDKGYTLLLSAPHADGITEFSALRAMLARGVDAIALLGFEDSQETKNILSRYRVPHAHMWSDPRHGGNFIGLDEAKNGRIAIEHLSELGHRKIGVIWGPIDGPTRFRSRLRFEGLEEAATDLDIEILPKACVYTEHGFEQGRKAINEVLDRDTEVTAIVCASDYLALGAMNGLHLRNKSPGKDLSIISFNDNDFSAYVHPPLTTIHLPIREMGLKTGHYLLKCLGEEMTADTYLLDVELRVRATCRSLIAPK